MSRRPAAWGVRTRQLLGTSCPRSLAWGLQNEGRPAWRGDHRAARHRTVTTSTRRCESNFAWRSLPHQPRVASPAPCAAQPRGPSASGNRAWRGKALAVGCPGKGQGPAPSPPRAPHSGAPTQKAPWECPTSYSAGLRSAAGSMSGGRTAVLEPETGCGKQSLSAVALCAGVRTMHLYGVRPAKCALSPYAKQRELGLLRAAPEQAEEPRPCTEPGARSRGPAQPPPPSALTIAEAERSQHEGQHRDDLGIHGTGGRRRQGNQGQRLSERNSRE